MSEYIEIESEFSEQPNVVLIHTNLKLTEGLVERYDSPAGMEEGSPLAQVLSMIDGLVGLTIHEANLTVVIRPDAEWHTVIADISTAIKDFYL